MLPSLYFSQEGAAQQAKSLKCDDCGKSLKSEIDAQAHASRTSHSNFSESTDEIKPLTEEEKKEQLAKIQVGAARMIYLLGPNGAMAFKSVRGGMEQENFKCTERLRV